MNVESANISKCNVQFYEELHDPGCNHFTCLGIQEFHSHTPPLSCYQTF